jgi:N-acetylglucosamine repressor
MPKRKKATRKQTKKHNSRLVLKTIYDVGEISRASIARFTDLTRPTVSAIVAELMDQGLVQEVGRTPSRGGKPATLLSVIDDSRHLIGLDLADSQFRGAVVNLRGEIRHRVSIPVHERDGEAALALVHQLLDELIASAGSPILGVGIGTPGLMDAEHGIVRTAVNLDWQDLPLGDMLTARYGIPVYIANDSQVAALGEFTFGQHDDLENLTVLKVGRGIGAGIIIDGELYYGDNHGAGEIGHFKVVDDGELCRCGQFGCLETVSSTRAVVRQARVSAELPTSSLHDLIAVPAEITTDVVLEASRAGDAAVEEIVANAGRYLGFAAAGLVSILNIETVVVAGSAVRFGSVLLDPLRQEMQRRSLQPLAQNTCVMASQLGTDIVILGAAALLLDNELGLVG